MAVKGRKSLNNTSIYEVDANPITNIDENCQEGSIALFNDGGVGRFFLKQGSTINDWQELFDEFIYAILTNDVYFVGGNLIVLPFNSTLFNTEPNNFSINGSGEITVARAGLYQAVVDVSIDANSSSRTSSESWIEVNGVEIDGSRAFGYHRNTSSGEMTKSITRPLTLAVNDVVRVRSYRSTGSTTLNYMAHGCRIKLSRLFK